MDFLFYLYSPNVWLRHSLAFFAPATCDSDRVRRLLFTVYNLPKLGLKDIKKQFVGDKNIHIKRIRRYKKVV